MHDRLCTEKYTARPCMGFFLVLHLNIAPSDDVRLFREYLSTTIARSETEKKTYT